MKHKDQLKPDIRKNWYAEYLRMSFHLYVILGDEAIFSI